MGNEGVPFPKALQIYEPLHSEAGRLGVIAHDNILDGIIDKYNEIVQRFNELWEQ